MATVAIQNRLSVRELVERKSWTAEDWREVRWFLAQSAGLVCGAMLLYSLGPALGVALVVGGLATGSLCRKLTGSAAENHGPGQSQRPSCGRFSAELR
jgi:hypothetical protein